MVCGATALTVAKHAQQHSTSKNEHHVNEGISHYEKNSFDWHGSPSSERILHSKLLKLIL